MSLKGSSSKHLRNAQWQKDATQCGDCNKPFSIVNRKHHCRRCGNIFCSSCSDRSLLIPREQQLPGSSERGEALYVPQRCCNACADVLLPLQKDIQKLFVQSGQDIGIDRTNTERYFSLPTFTSTMETDITQAVYTLYNFTSDNAIEGRDRIPKVLLKKAKGIVFMTIAKAGFGFSGRYGSGVVIAKLPVGSGSTAGSGSQWSGPSALSLTGIGFGMQVGGEIMDLILILRSSAAVRMFMSGTQVSLGTGLSVSVGPVGRAAETNIHAGSKGATAAYSYAHCKGVFAGASLEASVMSSRDDINRMFYGDSSASPARILSGEIPPPIAAAELYRALNEVLGVEDEGTVARKQQRLRRKQQRARKLHELQRSYGLTEPTTPVNALASSSKTGGMYAKSLKRQFRKLWTSNKFDPTVSSKGSDSAEKVVKETIAEYPPIPVIPPVGYEVYVPSPPLDTWTALRLRAAAAKRRQLLLDRWYRRQQSELARHQLGADVDTSGASNSDVVDSDDDSSSGSERSEGDSADEDVLEGYQETLRDNADITSGGDNSSGKGKSKEVIVTDSDELDGEGDEEAPDAEDTEPLFDFIENYAGGAAGEFMSQGQTGPGDDRKNEPQGAFLSVDQTEDQSLEIAQSSILRASQPQVWELATTMTMDDVERLMELRASNARAGIGKPQGNVSDATIAAYDIETRSSSPNNSKTVATTTAAAAAVKSKRQARFVVSTELKPWKHIDETLVNLDSNANAHTVGGGIDETAVDISDPVALNREKLLTSILTPNAFKTQSYARWRYTNQLTGHSEFTRSPNIVESDSFKNAKSVWEQLEMEGYVRPNQETETATDIPADAPVEHAEAFPVFDMDGNGVGMENTMVASDNGGDSLVPALSPRLRRRDRAKVAFKSMLASVKRAIPGNRSRDNSEDDSGDQTNVVIRKERGSAMSRAMNMSILGLGAHNPGPKEDADVDASKGTSVAGDGDTETNSLIAITTPVHQPFSIANPAAEMHNGSGTSECMDSEAGNVIAPAVLQLLEGIPVAKDTQGCELCRCSNSYDLSDVVEM